MSHRWKIVIVNRAVRYRKITRKGGIHNRRYRDMLAPVGVMFCLGSRALRGVPDESLSPYFDSANPSRPRIMEMHARTWEQVKEAHPEFAQRCDLFRRVETVRDGMLWLEEVPL